MTDFPEIGRVYEVEYPFVRNEQPSYFEPGEGPWDPWSVGIRYESVSRDDAEPVADGLGKMLLTVIDVHKPGTYATRCFYTRQWVSPSGKRFGKGALRICAIPKFQRLTQGYGYEFKKPDGTMHPGARTTEGQKP